MPYLHYLKQEIYILNNKSMNPLQESLSKCKVQGNTLFLPTELLTNYAEVKKALMNSGGKYKRNTFVFNSDAQPFIDRLMGGESVNIKKEFQFFGTPDTLADQLVELAEIGSMDSVLEPSAGQGAIVNAIIKKGALPISVCELMPENKAILKKNIAVKFICDDFLQIDTKRFHFTKIVANPPFRNNSDISHIMKMYECLHPKGRLVSIASKHWQFAQGKKETAFVKWLNKVHAIIKEVPAGEFKESGTNIATCIIIIDKK